MTTPTKSQIAKRMESLEKMMARRVEMLKAGRMVDIIDMDIAQINGWLASVMQTATPDWRPTETIAEDYYAA